MVHAVMDADYVKYGAASAGEKRTIQVVHKSSGREMDFANRTEFWGAGAKRDGGWLGKKNEGRTSPFVEDDFEIFDIQSPEPIENVLHLAKTMMEKLLRASQADSYVAYLGKGDSFRRDISTILEYKGNRKDMLRPVHLEAVADYLERQYKAKVITGIEADDQCVIDCVDDPASILVGVDKDYYGSPVNFLNANRLDEGVIKCNQFGELYKDEKGKVRGFGRMFLYHQICSGDAVDNYKANSASSVKWGEASSYKELTKATNDREAWAIMKQIYMKLYPEPTVVTGWRGDEIEIDWEYMLRENFHLARMLRFEGDVVHVEDILQRYDLL